MKLSKYLSQREAEAAARAKLSETFDRFLEPSPSDYEPVSLPETTEADDPCIDMEAQDW